MSAKLDQSQVNALLNELCVRLGFCLPPEGHFRIQESPPTEIDEFANSVFAAEGLHPEADVSCHLRREVEATIAKYFEAAEDHQLANNAEISSPITPRVD